MKLAKTYGSSKSTVKLLIYPNLTFTSKIKNLSNTTKTIRKRLKKIQLAHLITADYRVCKGWASQVDENRVWVETGRV